MSFIHFHALKLIIIIKIYFQLCLFDVIWYLKLTHKKIIIIITDGDLFQYFIHVPFQSIDSYITCSFFVRKYKKKLLCHCYHKLNSPQSTSWLLYQFTHNFNKLYIKKIFDFIYSSYLYVRLKIHIFHVYLFI